MLRSEFAAIKDGPRRYKTACLLYFGDANHVSSQELVLQAWEEGSAEDWVEVEPQKRRWFCEGPEIDRLRTFLNAHLDQGEVGNYVVTKDSSGNLAELLNNLASSDSQGVDALLEALAQNPSFLDAAAEQDLAEALINGLATRRQAAAVERLKRAVLNPHSNEAVFQSILSNEWWIFGGRYTRVVPRRALTVLDQIDLPLIRTDSVLHLIELKRANIPKLVVPHRNHLIVGPEVNEAVNQVANYLRALDEERASILANLRLDCRRAFATVVIGSVRHVPGLPPNEVAEAIRTYNAHLSRIEVLTYDDLIGAAENSIAALRGSSPLT